MVFFQKKHGWTTVEQPSLSWIQTRLTKEAQTQEIWLTLKSGVKPQGWTTKRPLLMIVFSGLSKKEGKLRKTSPADVV